MSYSQAVKFLLALSKNKNQAQQPISYMIDQEGFSLPFDVYEPAANHVYKGTILFIHGMNHLGNKDHRIMNICRAAAHCGYRAIAPSYSIIENYIVDMKSADEFVSTILYLTADKTLCPSGKIAIFSASFSGALCLRAIRFPKVANKVSSFCSVGISYYPYTTFGNILSRKTTDYYAKLISIKNLLRLSDQLPSELEKGMDSLIADAHELKGWPRFEKVFNSFSLEAREKLLAIQEAVISQRDLTPEYKNEIEVTQQIFMKDTDMRKVPCPVTLIHSVDDDVMPTVETTLLYKDLKRAKRKAKMVLTPLLAHADLEIGIQHMLDLYRLVSCFNYFLKHV